MNSRLSFVRTAVLAVACAAVASGCGKKATPPAPAPQTVGVYTVQAQTQAVTTELPGRTSARLVAEIRPQVGGIVQRRLFEEGAPVKAGQVLYQLDPAGFEASLASARAALAKAEAVLASAEATARRNEELARIDAISRQQADDSAAALGQARAERDVARAAVATARINLDRTRITSPIAGRADLSTVTPGALVTANQDTALTTVQQLDPLHVDVVQSSAELLRLKQEIAEGTLKRNASGDAPIRVILEDGSLYPLAGQLRFSGVTVNRSTGAVTLRALVPNPDGLLMPGMYVRARLETGVLDGALLVPQQGITRTPSGNATALVVGPGDKVELRPLTVGRVVGNRWQVTSGLKVGDRVVVDGLQRARAGAVVKPVPAEAAPSGAAAGRPAGAASAASATH